MSTIDIQLFGAFRELAPCGRIEIEKREGETVRTLKDRLAEALENRTREGGPGVTFDLAGLLSKSVLASGSDILGDDDLARDSAFALLPPVCGG